MKSSLLRLIATIFAIYIGFSSASFAEGVTVSEEKRLEMTARLLRIGMGNKYTFRELGPPTARRGDLE